MFGKVVKPCPLCPFRLEPRFQGLRRAQEIADVLTDQDGTFACHETTGVKGTKHPEGEQHCAGAVKILLSEGRHNQMMRICGRLGIFKPEDYSEGAECYATFEEWVEAMEEGS